VQVQWSCSQNFEGQADLEAGSVELPCKIPRLRLQQLGEDLGGRFTAVKGLEAGSDKL
jgi:hypothetical protein